MQTLNKYSAINRHWAERSTKILTCWSGFASSDTRLVSLLMTAFTTKASATIGHQYRAANLQTCAVRAVQARVKR